MCSEVVRRRLPSSASNWHTRWLNQPNSEGASKCPQTAYRQGRQGRNALGEDRAHGVARRRPRARTDAGDEAERREELDAAHRGAGQEAGDVPGVPAAPAARSTSATAPSRSSNANWRASTSSFSDFLPWMNRRNSLTRCSRRWLASVSSSTCARNSTLASRYRSKVACRSSNSARWASGNALRSTA